MVAPKAILLDSNIIIYTGLTQLSDLRNWLKSKRIFVSVISQLEVLGYHQLNAKDRRYFENFFKQSKVFNINLKTINEAILYRRQKSMSLGDAVIGATAKIHNLPLVSANLKDFKHIENIELINPLEL